MNNKIMKELEEDFTKVYGSHRIGDIDCVPQINILGGGDMHLENILILTCNLLKVNQHRLDKLENNLNLLAERIWDTAEEFTNEEIIEIKTQLSIMDTDDLKNVRSCKIYLYDYLFSDEGDINVMTNKADVLINKILYPNKNMYDAFNQLVDRELQKKYEEEMRFEAELVYQQYKDEIEELETEADKYERKEMI